MTRAACLAFLGFTLSAAPVVQVYPNFSGTWITVPSTSASASAQAFSSWRGDVTLTQNETTFTVEYVSNSRAHAPVKLIYNFDGSERKNIDPNSVQPQDRITRATWQGSKLVLTTVWPGRQDPADYRAAVETTETLSLDSPTTMSVEIRRRSQNGTATGTLTYRRR